MPNKAALVEIIHSYLKGEDIDEVEHQLKKRCKHSGGAESYRSITSNEPDYNDIICSILDELSIGGSAIHLMPINKAVRLGYINCYVWNSNKLVYLTSNKSEIDIPLNNPTDFNEKITNLSNDRVTFHLTAKRIENLITLASSNEHIPPTTDLRQIQSYKESANLYIALKKIQRQQPHLSLLVEKIEQIPPTYNWWPYIVNTLGLSAFIGFLYVLKENIKLVQSWFERALPMVTHFLGQTLQLLRNTPLIGILSNALPLLNAWYNALFSDSSSSDWDQAIKLLFKTIEHSMPIAGYVFCYFAAGTMTMPALTMFIAGAAIEIIHTLYTLIKDEVDRAYHPLAPDTEYYSKMANFRANNIYERGLFTFLIKFVANLISTTLVVIWCIYPPSLVIALPCVILSLATGLAKSWALNYINDSYARALQENLRAVNEGNRAEPEPQTTLDDNPLIQENTRLQQRVNALEQEVVSCSNSRFTDGYQQGARDTLSTLVREHGFFAARSREETPAGSYQVNEDRAGASMSLQ